MIARIATATGWTMPVVHALTLWDAYDLMDAWDRNPPYNELMAMVHGWGRELTVEEKIARGAMGPADFLQHYQSTKGGLPGDVRAQNGRHSQRQDRRPSNGPPSQNSARKV